MKSIPKVGDKLRVRDWEDMAREFGLDEEDDIDYICFVQNMRKFCGKIVTIKDINYAYEDDDDPWMGIYEDEGYYHWCKDMFCEPVPAMKHRSLQLYLQQRRAQS